MDNISISPLKPDNLDSIETLLSQHTEKQFTEKTLQFIRNNLHNKQHIYKIATVNGTVIAFVSGIVYTTQTSNQQYNIKYPSKLTELEGTVLQLKHGYVERQYIGNGVGTELIETIVSEVTSEFDLSAIFAESWIKPNYRSSDELLEKLGFNQLYHAENYFGTEEKTKEDYNTESNTVCEGCDTQLWNCKCSGSIYIHNSPQNLI